MFKIFWYPNALNSNNHVIISFVHKKKFIYSYEGLGDSNKSLIFLYHIRCSLVITTNANIKHNFEGIQKMAPTTSVQKGSELFESQTTNGNKFFHL